MSDLDWAAVILIMWVNGVVAGHFWTRWHERTRLHRILDASHEAERQEITELKWKLLRLWSETQQEAR